MKINILLPFFVDNPGGGIKVMYQYANELTEKGHDVIIYHALKTSWLHKRPWSLKFWKLYLLQPFFSKLVVKRPTWFSLHPSIQSLQIAKVDDHLIRDAAIVFSTWWATAVEMAALNPSKGRKFNLIQDDGSHLPRHQELIHQSYRLAINYVTIATHLQELFFEHAGKMIPIINNAIDPHQFYLSNPIESRTAASVIMLYSNENGKGSRYGLDALKKVSKKYPSLLVRLFGVPHKGPNDLPSNFSYYHKPNNLAELYNTSAIFISPSLQEGWGLPPMEAMACGCACICTNIKGHIDFMDDRTALLVKPASSDDMALGILKLIEDHAYRINLAHTGAAHVQKFTWDDATSKLENLFTALPTD